MTKIQWVLVISIWGALFCVYCTLYIYTTSRWFRPLAVIEDPLYKQEATSATGLKLLQNTSHVHYLNSSSPSLALTSRDLLVYPNCTLGVVPTAGIVPICLRTPGRRDFPEAESPPPVVVLMTTLTDVHNRRHIHENLFRLWSSLGGDVRPVLFVSTPVREQYVVNMACNYGFDVYVAPLCNAHRLPVLKAMFAVGQRMYPSSTFQGYVNGDILFDETLLQTLQFLKRYRNQLPKMLVVGRRMDIVVSISVQFYINYP